MKGGSCTLNMTLRIFEIEGLFQHSGTTFSIAHHLSRHNQIRDQGKKNHCLITLPFLFQRKQSNIDATRKATDSTCIYSNYSVSQKS